MLTEELVGSACPYCGEPIQLLVDWSVSYQEYTEDCQVCCRPIVINSTVSEDGEPTITVKTETD